MANPGRSVLNGKAAHNRSVALSGAYRKKRRKCAVSKFGGVIMQHGICARCGDRCLICGDGTSSCCSGDIERGDGTGFKVESAGATARRRPKKHEKERILVKQEGRCYWCDRPFGRFVISPRGKTHELQPNWDHYIPFAFSGDNSTENFVAACQRCNLHKSSSMAHLVDPDDESVLRDKILGKWAASGWVDV